MPLYEYECKKCGKRVERIEKMDGPHLRKCPHCGGLVDRLMSRPAIQFKGSGWYVTDYARSSSTGDSEKRDSASEAEKAEAKPADKPAEKKAAAQKEKKTVAKEE